MAPVAGGVPDREQDRDVATLGLGERLRSPFPPVDGIVGVLQEIGAGGLGQAVRHGADATTAAVVDAARLGLSYPHLDVI